MKRSAAEIHALVQAHYANRMRTWKIPVRIGSQLTHVTLHERDAAKALERAKRWAHTQPWTLVDGAQAEEHPAFKLPDPPQFPQNFDEEAPELHSPPGEILSTDATLDDDAHEPIVIEGDEGEHVEDIAQHNVEAVAPEAFDDRAVPVPPPATQR